jgi:protein-L-isoaspartate(D-aspartate) O-methyltransferase
LEEADKNRMTKDDSFLAQRLRMVTQQIEARGIHEPRLLAALRVVPRHRFVAPEYRGLAYSDSPLPIGLGQTISQPYIVALMTELLELQGAETVLEVGTGSGYQAAVLARLARQVHTVERHAALAENAARTLAELGHTNVHVHVGDGSLGWPEAAPYQAIIVTAAAPGVPQPLLDQLAHGGRLALPVGSLGGQVLELWTCCKAPGAPRFEREAILPVAFVPLRGQYGWEDQW